MKRLLAPTYVLVLLSALALLAWRGPDAGSALAQTPDFSRPGPHAQQEAAAPIAPALARELARSRGPVSFLVILEEQPDAQVEVARRRLDAATAQEKRAAVYRYLTAFARQSQAPLKAWLERQGIPYRSFYLFNGIQVEGDEKLVDALRRRPEVARLAADPRVSTGAPPQTQMQRRPDTLVPPDIPYGIRYARAPEAWARGYTGAGVVIGSQDTGVYWEHPALKEQYRGWDSAAQTATHPYNWYDPWGAQGRTGCDPDPQVPCDDFGHGTHTVGTMVGRDAHAPGGGEVIVGMAYDAKWIGCRNMLAGTGSPSSYTACFEFFLAPFPQNGDPQTDGDPSRGAHIVNNSWYCPPEEGCDYDSLRRVVQNVRAAGLLIVASAGNNGPACSTVQYPISAYPEVFAVGAHNGSGDIASFSSRGPVTKDGSGRLKPHITAAGEAVLSTLADGGYGYNSGTSMAAPHAAGAAALLWSAVPSLVGQVDLTEQVLMKSATPVPNNACDNSPTPVSPNNTYGYGRLQAAAAVEMALHPATLTVTLQTVGRAPAAEVTLVDDLTGYTRQTVMDASGRAVFTPLYPGNYTVVVRNEGGAQVEEKLTVAPGEQRTLAADLLYRYYFPRVHRATGMRR